MDSLYFQSIYHTFHFLQMQNYMLTIVAKLFKILQYQTKRIKKFPL